MEIISFISNSNNFNEMAFTFLNLNYSFFKDLYELKKKLPSIKNEYIFLMNNNYGLTKSFVKNIEIIKNLTENTITSSINIYDDLKQKDEIIDFEPIQSSSFLNKKSVTGIYVKKEDLIQALENEIKCFNDVIKNIKFSKICLFDCLTRIGFVNNMIDENNNLFFSSFRNKKCINEIKFLKKDYFKYLNGEEQNVQNNLIKIYNSLNEVNNNSCVIDVNADDVNDIILNYVNSPLNNKLNRIFLINHSNKFELNLDNIESKTFYCNNDLSQNIDMICRNTPLNSDIYFINKEDKLTKFSTDKGLLYHNGYNFDLLKIKCYILKFFSFDFTTFDEYISKMGNISRIYLKENMEVLNDPIFNKTKTGDIKFEPNIEFIDELYESKQYDECILLINMIIKNRISYNHTFIFKTIALIDKINLIISEKEVQSMIDLLKINNFDDVFNIIVVLISNNLHKISHKYFTQFILENEIEKKDLIKFTIICKWFGIFEKQIDISTDKLILNNLVENLEYLCNYIQKVELYDPKINTKNLLIEILIYLNNRFDLIDNEEVKNLISKKISEITFDFNEISNLSEEIILNKIKESPILVLTGCFQLSDFMMSNEDILRKRKNLLIVTRVIIKNLDNLLDTFHRLINQKKNINLLQLFRFAYHGEVNKELFHNCVTISKKFMELKIKHESYNYDLIKDNDKLDVLYFTPKKTNKKKICFVSDFLTRKHSVFKDRHQVIVNLIKKGFEVHIATFSPFNFEHSQIFNGVKENIILSNMNIEQMVFKLRSFEFDKLVFCEIGMDSRISILAQFRLANKQYNTWGHSDTSGFEHIDYFVSSKLYELPYEESKEHYTEKLILQNGMCTCYVNPTSKYKLTFPRSYFGLSEFEKIILCPQSLFKIHPNFDEYIFKILKNNPDSSIVLLDNLEKKYKMYERWNLRLKNMPEYYGVLSRVKFIGGQDHQRFCNLMKCADVLIDPYPFGGCNSSLESFSLFKPLVTQPSTRINGRFTYGFYNKMNMKDMIANNMDEYVDITTRLLNDKEFYDKQVNLLKERSDCLFEDQETLKEWEELMAD